ncbi:loganic acid O-methyltransferase-like [Humulus lupulus]|uniref:loganic acid O-methyltransferase-like n=1 Tax=Humulus lupulus TaxID=3486 RepID=UPI002B40DDFE|nr:loganic acid O-methyltransferase-like [Humulus lupulus]
MAFSLSSTESFGDLHTVLKREKMMSVMPEVVVRPMNGGNGHYSYTKNSTFQRKAIEAAKELINKSISEKLDIETLTSCKTFKIADLGCSVGPNTLLAVQTIIDAVVQKFKSQRKTSTSCDHLPEFQVFFNDQASNDFNQLFTSLPPKTQYFAAGVPGSFHRRLFPNASLNFVHSSCAVQWLSRVPPEVLDKSSPAWNKGKVHYSNSSTEVVKAFEAQYAKDLGNFLNVRAQEIVHGGLMALIIPGRPNGTPHSDAYINKAYEYVDSSLIDMAKKGKISNEKLDSFNFPIYYASLHEVESVVKQNGWFSLEIMENLPHEKPQPKVMSVTLRAGLEGTVKDHFGDEVDTEELFDLLLCKKLEEAFSITESCESVCLFVLLKRTPNDIIDEC